MCDRKSLLKQERGEKRVRRKSRKGESEERRERERGRGVVSE